MACITLGEYLNDLIDGGIDVGLNHILKYPTICDYYFYAKLMFALLIIFTMTIWYKERDATGRGDLIGALWVSSIAVIFLSLIGTALEVIQRDVFIIILVIGIVLIGIGFMKK